jgi:hypothetical protein
MKKRNLVRDRIRCLFPLGSNSCDIKTYDRINGAAPRFFAISRTPGKRSSRVRGCGWRPQPGRRRGFS